MATDPDVVFSALKSVFAKSVKRLSVKVDTPVEYTLLTRKPSPFPQHKGHPLQFGAVKRGKAYVGFHLMPLYMSASLTGTISPALKKRMHGKTCFNFKEEPEAELLAELGQLTDACMRGWAEKNWL